MISLQPEIVRTAKYLKSIKHSAVHIIAKTSALQWCELGIFHIKRFAKAISLATEFLRPGATTTEIVTDSSSRLRSVTRNQSQDGFNGYQ